MLVDLLQSIDPKYSVTFRRDTVTGGMLVEVRWDRYRYTQIVSLNEFLSTTIEKSLCWAIHNMIEKIERGVVNTTEGSVAWEE